MFGPGKLRCLLSRYVISVVSPVPLDCRVFWVLAMQHKMWIWSHHHRHLRVWFEEKFKWYCSQWIRMLCLASSLGLVGWWSWLWPEQWRWDAYGMFSAAQRVFGRVGHWSRSAWALRCKSRTENYIQHASTESMVEDRLSVWCVATKIHVFPLPFSCSCCIVTCWWRSGLCSWQWLMRTARDLL